ncbi:MAG: hypothetical protein EOO53_03825 [Gammaproteobacteria bacterium]|nr:MAG: hypothetical protein EOO53_03825 [Gammaproteobacteria bacterium]
MKVNIRRQSSQAIDEELTQVISEHLTDDISITVRSLVRRMRLVNNASSITRCSERVALEEAAKKKQQETRCIAAKIAKTSTVTDKQKIIGLELALSDALDREKNLKIAFSALMKAAAIHGVNWISFFEGYEIDVNTLPKTDNVKTIK